MTALGYLAASTRTVQLGAGIFPIYSRTPTLTVMTAAGLDCHPDSQPLLATLSPLPVREISPLAPSLAV